MKTLKNQFGLFALAAVILLVAAFAFFGSENTSESVVMEADAESETTTSEGTNAPAATTPTKASAPKPATPTTAPAAKPSGLNGSTFRLSSYNGVAIPSGEVYLVTFSAGIRRSKTASSRRNSATR